MSVHVKFMRFFRFSGIILSCNLQLKAEILNFYCCRISVPPGESIDYPIDVINILNQPKKQIFQ